MITLKEIEEALDQGRLFILVRPNKKYKMRRNGMTKLWKKDVSRFRIPTKYAFNSHYPITENDLNLFHQMFVIEEKAS